MIIVYIYIPFSEPLPGRAASTCPGRGQREGEREREREGERERGSGILILQVGHRGKMQTKTQRNGNKI